MVRNIAADYGIRAKQKRNSVRAARLGSLRPNQSRAVMRKLQIPSSDKQNAAQDVLQLWNLELGICLEFGFWDLGFLSRG